MSFNFLLIVIILVFFLSLLPVKWFAFYQMELELLSVEQTLLVAAYVSRTAGGGLDTVKAVSLQTHQCPPASFSGLMTAVFVIVLWALLGE